MNLRLRGPNGQSTLSGVEPGISIAAFQELIAAQTGVPLQRQEILAGFPPRPLQVSSAGAAQQPLSSLGIANGDTLVVREAAHPAEPLAATAAHAQPIPAASVPVATSNGAAASYEDEDAALARAIELSMADQEGSAAAGRADATSQPPPTASPQQQQTPASSSTQHQPLPAPTSVALPDGSCVVRRLVDSDNSCLFNAVGYLMDRSRSRAPQLRRLIAEEVAKDPDTYSEAFLGKPNSEYCRWIQDPQRWGGAIELSILARHYGRELAAYDVQTQRCDVYGSDAGYSERAMLIYDGLHYDALAVAAFEGAPEEIDVTIFETGSGGAEAITSAAARLVGAVHAARQFTDTASFTLRCGVCQIGVKGEKEALEHAKATGHTNFSEYH